MLSIILSSFWGITYLNSLGLKVASWISTIGALVGTIFPMVLIAMLGLIWIYVGHHPSQIKFTFENFFPKYHGFLKKYSVFYKYFI